MPSRLLNQRGMTLITVLLTVVVIGLFLGLAGQSWSELMRRVREEELYFRGDQYRRAIQRYYEKSPGTGAYPTELKQLLRDPRFPGKIRYLRQLWSDPMTGQEWELIVEPGNKIKGVRSSSKLKPLRQKDFPEEYSKFENAESYQAWEFVFEPKKNETSHGQGTPTAASPAATSSAPATPQKSP